MRSILVSGLFFIISLSPVRADVRLNGSLIIQDSLFGAKYLGEIINDTNNAVSNVKITITAKNAQGLPIDVSYGYVDGYTEPGGWSDNFIPPVETVPFLFFADVPADSITSYEYSITYSLSGKIYTPLATLDNLSSSMDLFGTTYYGEITNTTQTQLNFVSITFAFKDAYGNMIDIDYAYVEGSSHIPQNDTAILPGQKAPFELITFADYDENTTFYTIVNYHQESTTEEQFGLNEITLYEDFNVLNDNGEVKYIGYITNNTFYDIYFVRVSFTTRDSNGKILDIAYNYVSGTNYFYSETGYTDTHIDPFNRAPFEVQTYTPFAEMASYEYSIYLYVAEEPVIVKENKPNTFVLRGNYPNPFNPSTNIIFSLSDDMRVELSIYNSIGQKIIQLVSGWMTEGEHSVLWDASGFPSGVYLYQLRSENFAESKRMMLVK